MSRKVPEKANIVKQTRKDINVTAVDSRLEYALEPEAYSRRPASAQTEWMTPLRCQLHTCKWSVIRSPAGVDLQDAYLWSRLESQIVTTGKPRETHLIRRFSFVTMILIASTVGGESTRTHHSRYYYNLSPVSSTPVLITQSLSSMILACFARFRVKDCLRLKLSFLLGVYSVSIFIGVSRAAWASVFYLLNFPCLFFFCISSSSVSFCASLAAHVGLSGIPLDA